MTPDRYQRIKELFHSALERQADERPAFLAQECGGDTALLAKVEALIGRDEQSDNILDTPAYEVAAEMLTENSNGALEGQSISHYQIMSLLGSGGMGDVYLARDTRLGRRVALKLLPDHLTDDESGIRRFKQEARAASALNHPNVLTIYEIEQADGRYYIAAEYVEGETLRQHLKSGPVKSGEAIEIAAQIASALSKAHQASIIHRDIKPENIMLDAEGRIKVLDFGLAKYALPLYGSDTNDPGSEIAHTLPGTLMGTTRYMSPEQARGLTVDARTDIWSLGVVLYEMMAGHTPFDGQTQSDVLAAILEHEPEPLHREEFDVPNELQRIIRKALQKDREKRYQTSKDLMLDLENLRREMGTASPSGRVIPLQAGKVMSPTASTFVSQNKRMIGIILTVCLLLTAIGIYGTRMWRSPRSESQGPAVAAPAAEPERRLAYWLMVQKYRNGKPYQEPFRLVGEINFEKDYRVRLNLSGLQDGYLYILNEGPAPSGRNTPFIVLFPSPTANNGLSRLAANQQIQVPEQSWFQFDAEQGTEKVWMVWSANSVPALEAVKGFVNPRDRGLVSDPDLNNAVRDFLQAHQSPGPMMERDEEKKEVVIKSNGDILAYLLRLEHH